MKIIERVSIKHFRSFDGGVGQPKVEIIDLKDLNIFSGANDSGKSNILRALNLFFNNEVSPGVPFEIERDLSKVLKKRSDEKVKSKRKSGKKDVRQKDLWVQIRIHFIKEQAGVLPQEFWVEKMWDKNDNTQKRKSNEEKKIIDPNKLRAQEGQLTQFLNNIKFEYIPAVKDRQFFNHLFKKLQEYLFERQDRKHENVFKKHSSEFNELLKNETIKLFDEFKNNTNIEAQFSIPETLVDFFRTLSVKTENGVSLFDRGDGIQARFIPDILNEIGRDSHKKIIWGFEEPENSYEPLRCFELAQDFVKYSKEKQIFITSHAFPFIALEGKNISSYRVKNKKSISQIGIIDRKQRSIIGIGFEDEASELEKEVGILETYTRLSEYLGRAIQKQRDCVFIEDQYKQIYKIAWLKLNDFIFNKDDLDEIFQEKCTYNIFSKNGRVALKSFLNQHIIEENLNDKIIGIFDFDDSFNDFKDLNSERWSEIQGTDNSCLLRKRINHECFYAILIPVPTSRDKYAKQIFTHNYLIFEHLFEDEVLKKIDAFNGYYEPSGGNQIINIKGKKNLWKKILNLPKEDFKNFKPLFDKINDLFRQ